MTKDDEIDCQCHHESEIDFKIAIAMTQEKIYLELSEEGGGSHKFYEVIIEGTEVLIRYGRIGDRLYIVTTDGSLAD